MTALIIVICLAAQPSVCREERPPVDVSMVSCQVQGQLIAADWLSEHPKWTLRGWRCQVGGGRQT